MNRPLRFVAYLLLAMAAGSAWWGVQSCSGNDKRGGFGSNLENQLVTYQQANLVSFKISGDAACNSCGQGEKFAGLMVEVSLKGDATHVLAMDTFDGLGPFVFQSIRAPAGGIVQLSGTLYREGSTEGSARSGYAEVTAPQNDDNETVSVVLNFD